jgi:hypothetical protein
MTACLTPEQLAMYYADELAPYLRDLVQQHLATCDICTDLAEDIAACAVSYFEEKVIEDDEPTSSGIEDLEFLRQIVLERGDWVEQVLHDDEIEEILRTFWKERCNFVEPVILEDLIAGELQLASASSGFFLSQKSSIEELAKGIELIQKAADLIARFQKAVGRQPSANLVAAALGETEVSKQHPIERITAVVNSILGILEGQ